MYCGADISPYTKGCCSEARTVKEEGRERRRADKVKEPRIVSAPHAIDMQWKMGAFVRQPGCHQQGALDECCSIGYRLMKLPQLSAIALSVPRDFEGLLGYKGTLDRSKDLLVGVKGWVQCCWLEEMKEKRIESQGCCWPRLISTNLADKDTQEA